MLFFTTKHLNTIQFLTIAMKINLSDNMSNHEEDKLFMYATKEDGFSFINLIEEINWDIRKYDFKSENLTFNPTELIELDPAVYKSDMIMELDSIIVITEFQSTVVKKFDEKRYRLYSNC